MPAQTCRMCHGSSDDYKEADTLMRCSRCQQAYYCSTACQKRDWPNHKADCKPCQIDTAKDLARAVYRCEFPTHPQTCRDYGFSRAFTVEDKSNLLGLYIGLIMVMGLSPETIHDWRVRGVLADEIKAAYYEVPEHQRGSYFPWFLRNQHIVASAGQPLSARELSDCGDKMLLRSWRFIGGSERDSPEHVRAAIARKPADEQACSALYTLLLSQCHPSPDLDLWVDFGFASCTSKEVEGTLHGCYQSLIRMCTFKEFYDAYHGRRLLDLFRSNGLIVDESEQLRDLLHGPADEKKSVWYLKQFVLKSAGEESSIPPPVFVDYGFMSCRDASEVQQLKKVYKDFFKNHQGDALALHGAAIRGDLYGFLSNIVQRIRDPKFRQLMKNPYPLPDEDTLGNDTPPEVLEEDSSSCFGKLVLDLKEFVLRDDSPSENPPLPVMVDYGFINCQNASESQQLRKIYKDFFINYHGDPLALHEAAIEGKLYSFLSGIVPSAQGSRFQRLMKNPHPLPDEDYLVLPNAGVNEDILRLQNEGTLPNRNTNTLPGEHTPVNNLGGTLPNMGIPGSWPSESSRVPSPVLTQLSSTQHLVLILGFGGLLGMFLMWLAVATFTVTITASFSHAVPSRM